MSNVIVLGAGMVGSAMAIDMAKKHQVTLTDLSLEVLDHVKQKCSDLTTLAMPTEKIASANAVPATEPRYLWTTPALPSTAAQVRR